MGDVVDLNRVKRKSDLKFAVLQKDDVEKALAAIERKWPVSGFVGYVTDEEYRILLAMDDVLMQARLIESALQGDMKVSFIEKMGRLDFNLTDKARADLEAMSRDLRRDES